MLSLDAFSRAQKPQMRLAAGLAGELELWLISSFKYCSLLYRFGSPDPIAAIGGGVLLALAPPEGEAFPLWVDVQKLCNMCALE